MPAFPLTNFEIQKYYQNEPKFSNVYSRSNLPKTNDRTYVINLDECKSIENHWIALYVNCDNSFGITYISKEIKKFIRKQKHQNKF